MEKIEQISPTNQPQAADIDDGVSGNVGKSMELPHNLYNNFLNRFTETVPGIANDREAIQRIGDETIDQYTIRDGFFSDDGRAIAFIAIASRLSKAAGNEPEEAFLRDALTLLARKHSVELGSLYDLAEAAPQPSDEHELQVYDKYTDQQLSNELRTAIDEGGLLDDVKANLGVTKDNEDTFEVRVLDIGDSSAGAGIDSPRIPDLDSLQGTPQERGQAFDAAIKESDRMLDWKRGLASRWESFKEENGMTHVAPAWVTNLNGRTLLCLPLPYAEKILHPDSTRHSSYYTDEDRARDVAILKHEYVHTQGSLNIDHDTAYGISMEELRAEYFSGDKQGYHDIKIFRRDMDIITGHDLINYMKGKGGGPFKVWTELANDIGVDRLLEVMLVRPTAYDEISTNTLHQRVASYSSGYDGVTARLYEEAVQGGQKPIIDQRVDKEAKRLLARDADFLLSWRRGNGQHTVTDLLDKRVTELQAA